MEKKSKRVSKILVDREMKTKTGKKRSRHHCNTKYLYLV